MRVSFKLITNMRENELFRVTLEHLLALNSERYGGKMVLKGKEAADLCGVSVDTIYTHIGKGLITCEKLARWLSQ